MAEKSQDEDELPKKPEEVLMNAVNVMENNDVISEDTAEAFDEYLSEGLRAEAPVDAIEKLTDDIKSDED